MAHSFSVYESAETGVILKCDDAILADEFDDYLVSKLDKDIYFKFENDCVLFFFGRDFSTSEVIALYENFTKRASGK